MGVAWDTNPTSGLCVMDVTTVITEVPQMRVSMWRIIPANVLIPSSDRALRYYWQSEISDARDMWAYRKRGINWMCVEKNNYYAPKARGIRTLPVSVEEGIWSARFDDMSKVLLFIAPSGWGVSATHPSVRAALRHGRIILLFVSDSFSGLPLMSVDLTPAEHRPDQSANVADLNNLYYGQQNKETNLGQDATSSPVVTSKTSAGRDAYNAGNNVIIHNYHAGKNDRLLEPTEEPA